MENSRFFWLPSWAWTLMGRHLWSRHARPAIRWMNRFAFLGVTVGVFAWISVISIMNGLQKDIRTRVFQEKPHLLWEGTPRDGFEPKLQALRQTIGSELRSVNMILQTEGLLEIPSGNQRGRIAGSGVIIQGIPDFPKGLYLASDLASFLGIGKGDELKLRSAWKIEGEPFRTEMTGIMESGVQEVDRGTVRMNRADLENWLGLKGAVSRIEIQFQDPMRADAWAPVASQILGVPLKTWKQTNASLWYSLRLEKIFMSVVVFFIVILAALSVHLALSVRVAEKTREIGLLRGLGAGSKILSRIFLTEGAFIGICGSLLGLALSWIFCGVVAGYVKLPEFYYSSAIPVDWKWSTSFWLGAVSTLTAMAASLGPAVKAGKCTATEALRS